MRNKKINFLYIAIIVSIICAVVFLYRPEIFNKTGISSVKTKIVYMTDKGFLPKEIEIMANSGITFKNIDSNDHWPASNIHPSHGIYPEFDPQKSIPPGEKWSFTFTRPGMWNFHNHYFPQFTGTITVSEKNISESKKEELQDENFDNLPEVEKYSEEILNNNTLLKSYVKQYGVSEAMRSIIKLSNYGSSQDCHQQAHEIGRVGYKLSGAETFEQCDAACHSGCYHGAMEGFLNEKGTTNLARNIDEICRTFKTSFGIFECLHGVGHGILAYLDYNMLNAIYKCSKLKDKFSDNSCYGGMFMENILAGLGFGVNQNNHETSWLNNNDPYFPCNALDQNYDLQYQCYQMQTSWMLKITSYDFAKVMGFCLEAPDDFRSVCFKSFGRDAGGHTLRNPDGIIKLCELVPEQKDYIDQCYKGAVGVIIDFWGPNLKEQASELCKKIITPQHKEKCYLSINERIGGLSNDKRKLEAICKTFEYEYQKACLSSI